VSVLYGHRTCKRKHEGDVDYMEINSTVYILRSGDVDLSGNWDWLKDMLEEVPSLSNRKAQWLITLFAQVLILQCLSFWSMKLRSRTNFFALKHSG